MIGGVAMRVYKTKRFARLARKAAISDKSLCEAVWRAERGLLDAHVGRFLIKQRIARVGKGRSGGYRAVLFFRSGDLSVFLDCFAKSGKANLTATEEHILRTLADQISGMRITDEREAVRIEEWIEVNYGEYEAQVP